jgi:hypothetical protein
MPSSVLPDMENRKSMSPDRNATSTNDLTAMRLYRFTRGLLHLCLPIVKMRTTVYLGKHLVKRMKMQSNQSNIYTNFKKSAPG